MTFLNSVRNPTSSDEVFRFSSEGKYTSQGQGFTIEPNESGVVCSHPSKPDALFVPWSNVREMRFVREGGES